MQLGVHDAWEVGSETLKTGIALVPGRKANAHLIAAAPDLLEALQWALELYRRVNDGAFKNGVTDQTGSLNEGDVIAAKIIERARAAIAKATTLE